MRLLEAILDIIFPVDCLCCGKVGEYFCMDCLSKCPAAERESAKWIFPLFDYRHPPIKKAIWLIKYRGRKKIATVFGEVIYHRILEELSELRVMENFDSSILIPIPLSPARKRERGFNQAEILCQEITKLDKSKSLYIESGLLIKPKETTHQARIKNRNERLRNIIGSFDIKNPEKIRGRNIILIDDVTTTGATLSEARKVLKDAGARKVIAFAIAH